MIIQSTNYRTELGLRCCCNCLSAFAKLESNK